MQCASSKEKSVSVMSSLDRFSSNKAPAVDTAVVNSPAIRVQQLCRHYRMGETLIRAVDGVNLEVRAGEFIALLGSSCLLYTSRCV